jgi:hypothetical protein
VSVILDQENEHLSPRARTTFSLLRHTIITDTLQDPGTFADSRGQAEQVVNLFGTHEGAAIEEDGSSRRDFENGRGGVVDGLHADCILLIRVIEGRRWKQGGTDRYLC